jgi:hypothetical protein
MFYYLVDIIRVYWFVIVINELMITKGKKNTGVMKDKAGKDGRIEKQRAKHQFSFFNSTEEMILES